MRKKKASIIFKSIFLAILFGIAIYFSSNEKSTFESDNSLKFEDRNVDDSHNSTYHVPFLIPGNHPSNNHLAHENNIYGSTSFSESSGTPFNLRITTGTESESESSEMPETEERLVINTTPEYGGGGFYSNSLPIAIGASPVKSKKESKNSFGTTIASAKTGIGNAGNLDNPELPMAPPPPPVPLDGGTLFIIVVGLLIGFYKLILHSNTASRLTMKSND